MITCVKTTTYADIYQIYRQIRKLLTGFNGLGHSMESLVLDGEIRLIAN